MHPTAPSSSCAALVVIDRITWSPCAGQRGRLDSLSRCQQSLDCDIATEEERTRCSDDSDPAYSVLARSLIPRRDNVAATIAILQERLSKTELLISTGIGSVPEQVLPA
jgi:hypothetical protein